MSFVLPSVSQRWSSRGHILKSLALASKPTSPWPQSLQVLENAELSKKFFFWRTSGKFIRRPFFWRTLAPCVLGLERVCACKVGPWSWHRIFLCTWPRALCPRLYLCLFPLIFLVR